ncbi:MAG: DNA polymerase/3'-5' exonuclease PolX [Candidatus Helarchaeota archaeon]|nr:DNA polymerase/3'-5' exonuclease PolX [Candidatus Helarchaeota archaeon]
MRNQEVVDILYEIADILEIQGEIQWKFLAYRRAARTLENLSENIADVLGKQKLPGIGKALEEKIRELITTGKLEYFEKIKKAVPPIVIEMTRIPDVGPKTAKLIHDALKIKSLKDLEKATRSHRIQRVKGIGPKMEKAILKGLSDLKKPQRHLLGVILPVANQIYETLKNLKEVKQVSLGGSIRRRRETIRDIDILVTSDKPEKVMQVFTTMELVKKVVLKGPTKSTVNIKRDIQVDLRVVEDESYGAALQYFTGSKEHNVMLRTMVSQMGYKLNEYGVFLKDTDEKVAGKTEEEIYKLFGMTWIPPELREDRGEIEAAQTNSLPTLVELADIKGDLHLHTEASDGKNTLEEIVKAAKRRSYEYIAIADHVGSLKMANAIDEPNLLKQISQIRKLDAQEKNIRIFAGAEVNINLDGSLDLSEDVLSQLDVVICSAHSKLRMPRKEMTERVINALHNEYTMILGHPTNRLLNKRPPSDIDLIKVFDAAKDQGKILEINAYPARLDLNDVNSRTANQRGVLLTIGTDAHSITQLKFIELGVSVARRAWLEKKDLLNTLSLKEFQKKLKIE